MNQLDTMYRALKDYRRLTTEQAELTRLRGVVAVHGTDKDFLQCVRNRCEIEEDWVNAISDGLEYVGRALGEERQFIRTNGEVVPIEKVKRVSKDSIEHLAKHSNLISREPAPGEDIIPDQVYTVERLSDYTVYENRFIYMLLMRLKDFVAFRYDKIIDLTYTYNGKLEMSKEILFQGQKIQFNLTLNEERKNDPVLREISNVSGIVSKIEDIMSEINFYLSLPLMIEVSKAPLIKPPIVKTNVLRMNKNFKGAVALYDYVTSYEKEGYTVHNEITTDGPFTGDLADEMSEILMHSSFLAYENNLDLEGRLEANYQAEEKRKKEEEQKTFLDQLNSMRKRAHENGEGMEEYMLMLEKRVRALESESAELALAKQQIEQLNEQKRVLEETLEEKNNIINEKNMEAERVAKEHEEHVAKIHEEQQQEIANINAEHARNVERMANSYMNMISTMNVSRRNEIMATEEAHQADIDALNAQHAHETAVLETKHTKELAERDRQIIEHRVECEYKLILAEKRRVEDVLAEQDKRDALTLKMEELTSEKEKIYNDKLFIEGKYNALRAELGMIDATEDFTREDTFDELERQYTAFTRFYKEEWRKAKKRMRKEIMTYDAIKAMAAQSKKQNKNENHDNR